MRNVTHSAITNYVKINIIGQPKTYYSILYYNLNKIFYLSIGITVAIIF